MTKLSQYRPFFVAGSAFLVWMQIAAVILGFPGGLEGRADFRMFFAGGSLVRMGRGEQLYDYEKMANTEAELAGKAGVNFPFAHPAYEVLPFIGLSWLSYRTAYCLFFGINLTLLFFSIRLLVPVTGWLKEIWTHLPIMTVAGFLPIGICTILGQDSILLFTLITIAYVMMKTARESAAGAVLGLAMFRFPIILPLVLFFCMARRWKLLEAYAATSVIVVLLSVIIAGPGSVLAYPHLLLHRAGTPESVEFGIQPNSMPNLRGLIEFILGKWVSSRTTQIMIIASSVALVAWAAIKRLPFELLLIVALLVSYHELLHDSVLLLLPLLTLRSETPIKLSVWCLLLASPTLALLIFEIPVTLLAAVYLFFLLVMARGTSESGSELDTNTLWYLPTTRSRKGDLWAATQV
jgi:hypothetical protein